MPVARRDAAVHRATVYVAVAGREAGVPAAHAYRFEGLCLVDGIYASGVQVEIENCAVRDVNVSGIEPPTPQLHATSAEHKQGLLVPG